MEHHLGMEGHPTTTPILPIIYDSFTNNIPICLSSLIYIFILFEMYEKKFQLNYVLFTGSQRATSIIRFKYC